MKAHTLLLLVTSSAVLAMGCSGTSQPVGDTMPDHPVEDVEDGPSAGIDPIERFALECRVGLKAAKMQLPGILAVGGLRTVENLLEPYNRMQMGVEQSAAQAGLMDAVHPDEAIRKAAQECEQETSSFLTELSLNRELYDAFSGFDTSKEGADVQRLVAKILRDYRRAGVDKDEATRARLTAIDELMVNLGQTHGKNIVGDVRHIEVSVDQLKGLPKDYIEAHPPNEAGKVIITTNYPDYFPFATYADNDELRKELYIAARSRAKETNEATLGEILKLRAEKAKLLGYANWADYATEVQMMKSGTKAATFIAKIARIARKRGEREYKELLTWKKKHMDKKAKLVQYWQRSYIANKVKAENYSFDPQEVRPYFPFKQVQAGLLNITAKIYGIEYKPATDVALWHKDVSAFEVMRDGKKIGRVFLDMHPREGKYGHAAQFTLRSGVAGEQVPEGVLVCNFPNPADGPALMEHSQVTTMFHEFGHLMHHVIGGQGKWIEQSGVATEWDFAEAPSQMFEEWAWSHNTLSGFAKHHETGEVIPKEMVERMRRADKFGLGLQTMGQMFLADMSLQFHQKDPKTLNMTETVKKLQAKHTLFPFVEGTSFHTNFGHLNGYSALYYTYMWSLVIAKDLLTPFQEHGLMNSEWTHKYRDSILAPGGTKDAADLVADFLGRPYSFKAFENYLTN